MYTPKIMAVKGNTRSDDMILMGAAVNGEASRILVCLQRGVSANCRGLGGETPLHKAAQNGHVSCIRELLRNGADINAGDYLGATPLHWATLIGQKAAVTELLSHDAVTNIATKHGSTPLHYAAMSGDDFIIYVLLLWNAKINMVDEDANTPLHIAVDNGHSSCVEVLLASKPTTDQLNNKSETPYTISLKSEDRYGLLVDDKVIASRQHIQRLLQGTWISDLNEKPWRTMTKSQILKEHGKETRAANTDVLEKNQIMSKQTGLVLIANNENNGKRSDVNVRTIKGFFENLMYNSYIKQGLKKENLLKDIIEIKTRKFIGETEPNYYYFISILEDHGKEMMLAAAEEGDVSSILSCLHYGISVNCRGLGGETPLHKASQKGHVSCMRHLLRGGADINARDYLV